MTRRRTAPPTPAIDRSHILEDRTRENEIVRVLPADPDGQVEPGVYRIVLEAHNTRTGNRWVELRGGPTGYNFYRSVRPDRIRPANKGERARATKPINQEGEDN